MSDPSPTAAPSSQGGIDEQTLLIIVAAAAGTLFFTVVFLLCIVAYLYFKKDRVTQKKKKTQLDNRHRLFREPSNFNSKFADIEDLQDLEQASFFREMHRSSIRSQRSRRGSVRSTRSSVRSNLSRKNSTRKNPTFGKDDVYAGALEMRARNRRAQDDDRTSKAEDANNKTGIDNPAVDLSDEQVSTPHNAQDGTGLDQAELTTRVVTEAKVNILNPNTWKSADSDEEMPAPVAQDGKVFTISGGSTEEPKDPPVMVPKRDESNDEGQDEEADDERNAGDDEEEEVEEEEVDTYHMFSQFQRQHSQRRRSFKTRNSAVIDFYEGGALDSAPAVERQANPAPAEIRDPFWDGFGPSTSSSTAQGLLWQKKRIF